MVYIGNTQNRVKIRMTSHFGQVKDLVKKGMTSDSFAQHFAQHIDSTKQNSIRTRDIRAMVKMDIIWQGDPISCMKTFGTNSCKLCMKERLEILHRHRADPFSIINSNNKIY